MKFVPVSFIQTVVFVVLLALSSERLRCNGVGSVQGVATSTATVYSSKKNVDGALDSHDNANVISRKKKKALSIPPTARLGVRSSCLNVRGELEVGVTAEIKKAMTKGDKMRMIIYRKKVPNKIEILKTETESQLHLPMLEIKMGKGI